MDVPAPISNARADFVEGSVACRRCGYELAGLPVRGVCPECGATIARSLHGNLLEFADPAYLAALRRGATLIELGVIGVVAAFVLLVFAAGFNAAAGGGALIVVVAIGLISLAIGLLGWFEITRRERAMIGRDQSSRSRMITRVFTAIFAATASVLVAGALTDGLPALRLPTRAWFTLPAVVVASAAVQVPASIFYLRHLARRTPDSQLRMDIETGPTLAMVTVVTAVLGALLAMTAVCIGVLVVLVWLVMVVALLASFFGWIHRLRIAIAHAAVVAESGEHAGFAEVP